MIKFYELTDIETLMPIENSPLFTSEYKAKKYAKDNNINENEFILTNYMQERN